MNEIELFLKEKGKIRVLRFLYKNERCYVILQEALNDIDLSYGEGRVYKGSGETLKGAWAMLIGDYAKENKRPTEFQGE